MRSPAVARIAAGLLLAAAACKTPEEKLVDRRLELRALLQHIHEEFAGRAEGADDGGADEAGILGRLASSMERSHFEQYCLAVGRGESPFSLSGRLEAFMRDADHLKECRRAAELETHVEELERQVAKRKERSP